MTGRNVLKCLFTVALGLLLATPGKATTKKFVGTLSYARGEISRSQDSKGSAWTSIKRGAKLYAGDRVKSKKGSRAEATLRDGSVLRIGSGSEIKLQSFEYNKKNNTRKVSTRLFVGRLWAKVTSFFGGQKFEVRTRNAVAGVRGTRFSAQRSSDGTTQIKVYGGKVLVSNKPAYAVKGATKETRKQVAGPVEISKQQWNEMVAQAMQMVSVAANGDMTAAETFAMQDSAQDDWEAWNAERDKIAGLNEHP